mgnify:CR=1 FL=1
MSASLVVVSGPSGSGKTSLCKALCSDHPGFTLSISTTTRIIRDGEVNGVDYHFVSREEFLEDIENGFFIEWAEVHGNFYGTSKKVVEKELARDNTVIFDIDVQGHQAIRELYQDITTSVFVTTPTLTILKDRLVGRETDSQEGIDKRLINALSEMRFIKEYDYLIVNKDYEPSVERLTAIAKSSRYKRERFNLEDFLLQWNI